MVSLPKLGVGERVMTWQEQRLEALLLVLVTHFHLSSTVKSVRM